MKYALKFTPGNEIETTMWVWFTAHGTYYVDDRSGMVQEAKPEFIDSNLKPAYSGVIERIPFSKLPDHIQGHDAREIADKLPKEYAEDKVRE